MPAKSPADQLGEWTKKLVADQSQSADLVKEIDRPKNQIADLSKTISDIDQKKQAWAKSVRAAKQQQADLATYVKTKTTMLQATVADPKKISDAKDGALKALSDLQDLLDKANKAAAEKQEDLAKAKAAWIVELSPRSDYLFPAGITGIRGALIEEHVAPQEHPQPVEDAEVWLMWLDDDGATWHNSPVRSHSSAKGDFAAILRFAPNEVPHLSAGGDVSVRLRAKRAGKSEVGAAPFTLLQGRIADETYAWNELQF